jgi:hypothetical protein
MDAGGVHAVCQLERVLPYEPFSIGFIWEYFVGKLAESPPKQDLLRMLTKCPTIVFSFFLILNNYFINIPQSQ